MRILAVLVFGLMSSAAADDVGYAIIDATAIPTKRKQPTWIAVHRSGRFRLHHIRVGKTLVPLRPGEYRFDHVDFKRNVESGDGSLYPKDESRFQFIVEPDEVTFVGLLVVRGGSRRYGGREYRLELVPEERLLGWACAVDRQTMESMPVVIHQENGPTRALKVVCRD